jgi:phosphatidylserine decarboxylase
MIAREGIPFIIIGLALTVAALVGATRWDHPWAFGASVLFGLVTLFMVYFFRDPIRSFAASPNALVSPADGKVIGVERLASHPYVGGETVKISIFLSVFDVHVNRSPADGVVDYVKYIPGKFFAAFEDKASEQNEHTEIGMMTESGKRVMFKQIAGIIARRIVCRVHEHDTLQAGERFGMIRFGSRTELFVPAASEVLVKPGDRVYGGKTIVGYLSE